MNIQDYLEEKKKIQTIILDYLDNEEIYQNVEDILNTNIFHDNKHEL